MKSLLFYYCLMLSILLTLGAAYGTQTASVIPLILFLPISVYLLSLFLVKINKFSFSFPFQKPLSTLSLYYSFIVVAIMTISGFLGAKNIPQFLSGIIFLPLTGYFILRVLPKRKQAIKIPAIVLQPKQLSNRTSTRPKEETVKLPRTNEFSSLKIDADRRQFLKLISSAGLTLFLFSIFAKRAQAAFFGSTPGPGTIAIKDTSGTPINPAEKGPTDGYKIAEIADGTISYYGFTNKDGGWFIMKEDPDSVDRYYMYKKGSSAFDTAWSGRAGLSYENFEDAFD